MTDLRLKKMTKAELIAEVERLRKRTHQIAEDADRRTAKLARDLGRLNAAFERARETVKDIRADWTTDPPSQEEGGFWRYTSQATTTALAFMAKRLTEVEAERDRWRLAAELTSRGRKETS